MKPLAAFAHLLAYAAFIAVQAVVRLLPAAALPALAGAMARAFGWLFPSRLRIARDNIRLALGDSLSEPEVERLARDSVAQLFQTAMELVRLFDHVRPSELIERVDGIEHLQTARDEGRGILLLVGHFGIWDLGGSVLQRMDLRVHAVARVMDNPWLDRYFTRLREHLGVVPIPRENAMRAMLKRLAQRKAVAILADQHASKPAVTVPFFGQPAATVPTVARLAMQTGAAVIPGAIVRIAPMRHRIVIHPRVPMVRTGDRERDILANTAAVNEAYERMIRDRPDHWMWIHRRWKALDKLRRKAAQREAAGDSFESVPAP